MKSRYMAVQRVWRGMAIWCALLFGVPAWVGAQAPGAGDVGALLKRLAVAKNDTSKVLLLGQLSAAYNQLQPDTAIKYSREQLLLATRLVWVRGIAYANSSFAANYLAKNDLLRSAEYYNKAIEIWVEQDEKKMMADNYAAAAEVYFFQSDFPAALDYMLKACGHYEEIGNHERAAHATARIGDIYGSQKDVAKAMQHLQKALRLYETLHDTLAMGRVNASIGNVHLGQHDYATALSYFEKAAGTFEHMRNDFEMAYVYGNMGAAYTGLRLYSKALACYYKSMYMSHSTGEKRGEEAALGNIGEAYLAIAKEPYSGTMRDSLIPGSREALLQKSVEYLSRALAMCRESRNASALIEFYPRLSEAYSLSGQYKPALENHLLYTAIRDSIYNTENKIRLFNVQAQHEIELKNKQIDLDKLAVEKKRSERVFFIAGITGLIIVIFFIGRERRKLDKLLLNILPETIATELKNKGSTEVTYFDDVTVIFTDFVGFTKAGENMTPRELINELHSCFEAFDAIMGKYNVEKIKTIGDAYLAVSGVPHRHPAHAENVVSAALEICQFMEKRQQQLGDRTFAVRVGVNSGSVVAGIVGVKKFAYDIWGDTVNTAARMEQNSEAGQINISENTFRLIQDKFQCRYRGQILAKNKGAMKMYYVEKAIAGGNGRATT